MKKPRDLSWLYFLLIFVILILGPTFSARGCQSSLKRSKPRIVQNLENKPVVIPKASDTGKQTSGQQKATGKSPESGQPQTAGQKQGVGQAQAVGEKDTEGLVLPPSSRFAIDGIMTVGLTLGLGIILKGVLKPVFIASVVGALVILIDVLLRFFVS